MVYMVKKGKNSFFLDCTVENKFEAYANSNCKRGFKGRRKVCS